MCSQGSNFRAVVSRLGESSVCLTTAFKASRSVPASRMSSPGPRLDAFGTRSSMRSHGAFGPPLCAIWVSTGAPRTLPHPSTTRWNQRRLNYGCRVSVVLLTPGYGADQSSPDEKCASYSSWARRTPSSVRTMDFVSIAGPLIMRVSCRRSRLSQSRPFHALVPPWPGKVMRCRSQHNLGHLLLVVHASRPPSGCNTPRSWTEHTVKTRSA